MSFIFSTEAYYTHKQEAAEFKRSADVHSHDFLFDDADLSYVMSHFQEESTAISILAQMGGVEGISYALRTDVNTGLGKDEIDDESGDALEHRRSQYGTNTVTEKPPIPFYKLCLQELEDPMLKVLIGAGIISIITGAIQHPEVCDLPSACCHFAKMRCFF